MNPLFDAIPTPAGWHGITVRDQAEADRLIPTLLKGDAPGRFVRVEFGAGPVVLHRWLSQGWCPACDSRCFVSNETCRGCNAPASPLTAIVVAAGECGPDARPCHPAWLRSLRGQCEAAGVPFAFAGWGEFACREAASLPECGFPVHESFWLNPDGSRTQLVRQKAGAVNVLRVGPETSGRSLDGRTHDGGEA